MANATRSIASPTRDDSVQLALDWSTAFAQSLVQAQHIQLEALISWQQSLERAFAATNKKLWDA